MSSCEGNVNFLDTHQFSTTIQAFKEGVQEYNEIRTDVERITNALFILWQGKGKKQFEKDYTTIYRQLTDIEDILYELYNSLIDAQAAYIQADEEAAKMLTIQ